MTTLKKLTNRKPKTPQKKNPNEVSGRDLFQTPNYATDLLVPFLRYRTPKKGSFVIWECAAGQGKIVKRLSQAGFDIYGSDLDGKEYPCHNFLTQSNGQDFDCIVTNTPFSLKEEFYLQCRAYDVPFALLVPAEYSGYSIRAIREGAEKIIPTRRIDYITPNTLRRIHEGEIWENSKEFFPDFKKLSDFKAQRPERWAEELEKFSGYCKWDSIYDAPAKLLRKYSSSYYHSMWLTWGFNLGRSETFVELTNEMKDNI